MAIFADRADAGRQLAAVLQDYAHGNVIVAGLPRGGVPVAAEVAEALHAPLEVILVRKLGVPMHRELGVGAIAEDGIRVVDRGVQRRARVTDLELAVVEDFERRELGRRIRSYRRGRDRISFAGATVIVVDDGVAVGTTARAACRVARFAGAEKVVLAVPVAPSDVQRRLGSDADEIVAVQLDDGFRSVGQYYRDFSPTTDEEVVTILRERVRDLRS